MRNHLLKKPRERRGSNASIIEYWPTTKVKQPSAITRKHSSDQIEKIKRSFQQFGFMGALLVERSGEIIVGYGRYLAAKQLGYCELPVIVIDHLSEAQIKAFRIADNKLAEQSSWDAKVLRAELEIIASLDIDFDLEITGFETEEIDFLLSEDVDGENDPDDVLPDIEDQTPVSRHGDLWMMNDHLLLCGDAKAEPCYRRLLEGVYSVLVVTDPPWNVKVDGHVGNSGAIQHREFVEASGEMSDAEFATFLDIIIQRMADNVSKGALLFCYIDWRGVEKMLAAGRKAGLELLNIIVWNKDNAGMGSLYRSKHELVCLFKKPGASHQNNIKLGATGRYRTNVWDYAGANSFGRDRMEQLKAHPTAKPVTMIADAIKDVTKRGYVVLDPFCGSGTTLLAAERTGRIARCMELDPLYVDTAIRRFQERFGVEAIHQETGLTFSQLAEQRLDDDGAETASSEPQGGAGITSISSSNQAAGPVPLVRKRQRPKPRKISHNIKNTGRAA